MPKSCNIENVITLSMETEVRERKRDTSQKEIRFMEEANKKTIRPPEPNTSGIFCNDYSDMNSCCLIVYLDVIQM